MEIKTAATAGTLESSDALISVEPNSKNGIEIELNSSVKKQYGKQIKKVIIETLNSLGVKNVTVHVDDKGALDCVIRARLQTAIIRAAKAKFNWEEDDAKCIN
ncbi:MAG TPA: citrate lyase acyl carrier protein [Clostridiaceae bacterium]|nr:citrate lyase acyl carrier protein [Clostridiaceae bacterium]